MANYAARKRKNAIMMGLCWAASLFGLVWLGLILFALFWNGVAGLGPLPHHLGRRDIRCCVGTERLRQVEGAVPKLLRDRREVTEEVVQRLVAERREILRNLGKEPAVLHHSSYG